MPISYTPVYGRILSINSQQGNCCQQTISLRTNNGTVNFILSSDTYVVDSTRLRVGMQVAAFYDSNLPVPLIFPPQYRAAIITTHRPNETVAVNFFNRNLLAADGSLQLNLNSSTQIMSSNGQIFTCQPGNQTLIVYYSTTTRSLPPQTTPRKIIVLC